MQFLTYNVSRDNLLPLPLLKTVLTQIYFVTQSIFQFNKRHNEADL
jgi:hypothetical protein